MSSTLTRSAIVDALDDLGERSRVSYAERTSWDEPYPPSFVADRLEDLRRDFWWGQRIVFALLVIVPLVVFLGIYLEWPRVPLASGVLLFITPQIPPIRLLIRNGKLEQLYVLLLRTDGGTESSSSSTVTEAV